MTERSEKRILLISFLSGLAFAIAEFIFSIYSRSHSALTDAVYDMSELVFIALLLFLTPLFHKPMSEKHPYGYFQVESIFVIIKGVMMLSVTMGISADVIGSALAGGNPVNNLQVALFQLSLGAVSIVIFIVMKRFSKTRSPPPLPQSFWAGSWTPLQPGDVPRVPSVPHAGAHPTGRSLPYLTLLSPFWSWHLCCRRASRSSGAPSGTFSIFSPDEALMERSRPCVSRF